MSQADQPDPNTVDYVLRVEELCDRYEDELRAGRRSTVDEFLRAAGVESSAAPADLLRELARLAAAYPSALAGGPEPLTTGAEARRPRADAPPVPVIPGYEVLEEIGRGGMGVVYKARQVNAVRIVALKVVRSGEHASADERSRFRTEAGAVARLQHPHVVQVFEVDEYAGLPFFSMEFCTGGTLAERLRSGPLLPRDAAALIEKLAVGVQAAHDAGVIHRDLKPANVLLAADGTPKVTDFGLARLTDSTADHTATGEVLGTPSYMAPEQARGDGKVIGPPADVYALGAVLYECLTARPPFRGATALDTLEQVKREEPVAVRQLQPGVPRDLETVCHTCLEKEPGRRYATAAKLAEDLRAFLDNRPTKARPISRLGRLRRWGRRNPSAAALVAVVVAALGAAVGIGVDKFRSYQRELRQAEWNRYERDIRDAGHALARGRYDDAEAFLYDCPEYLRNVEWHVLRSACRPNLKLRLAHGSHVCGVTADLAEGKRIATAGMDGRVVLWDAESGRQLAVLRTYPKRVNNLASGARGKYLAAAWDEGVTVWDVTPDPPVPVAEMKVGGRVALAQDTDLVVLGGGDGRLTVWRLSEPKEREPALVGRYSGTIYCLALSPDGKQLAVGGMLPDAGGPAERRRSVSLRVWDVPKRQLLDHFRADYWIGLVSGLAWGAGDRRLVTVSNQFGVAWDTTRGQTAEALPGFETNPIALAFDPAGRHLAASFASGAVKVWEFQPNPRLIFARKPDPQEGSPCVCISFDTTGEHIAYSQRSEVFVERWKSHGGARAIPGHYLAYSPDGTRVATVSSDGSVRLGDATDGREVACTRTVRPRPAALAFSPDGAQVAIGSGEAVWIWNPSSGQDVKLYTHSGKVLCVAYSSSGGLLASSDDRGHVQVRGAQTGTLREVLPAASGAVLTLAFSPDGRCLAIGDVEGRVRLWDTRTRESVDLGEHVLRVTSVAFSPDGRWLASGSDDQTARIWEVSPARAEQSRDSRFTLPHGVGVAGVAFSADRGRGGRLVTLGHDGMIRFWTVRAGASRGAGGGVEDRHRELLSLDRWQMPGGSAPGLHVALRPDPNHTQVAVTFGDGSIEIRDGEPN